VIQDLLSLSVDKTLYERQLGRSPPPGEDDSDRQTNRQTGRQTDRCLTFWGAGPAIKSEDGLSRNEEGEGTGLEQRESTQTGSGVRGRWVRVSR